MYRVIIIASVVLTLFPVVGYMQKKELDARGDGLMIISCQIMEGG